MILVKWGLRTYCYWKLPCNDQFSFNDFYNLFHFFTWMSVCLHVCIYVYMHVQRPEEDVRFPGTSTRDGCALPYQRWELSPGPLEEQQVL